MSPSLGQAAILLAALHALWTPPGSALVADHAQAVEQTNTTVRNAEASLMASEWEDSRDFSEHQMEDEVSTTRPPASKLRATMPSATSMATTQRTPSTALHPTTIESIPEVQNPVEPQVRSLDSEPTDPFGGFEDSLEVQAPTAFTPLNSTVPGFKMTTNQSPAVASSKSPDTRIAGVDASARSQSTAPSSSAQKTVTTTKPDGGSTAAEAKDPFDGFDDLPVHSTLPSLTSSTASPTGKLDPSLVTEPEDPFRDFGDPLAASPLPAETSTLRPALGSGGRSAGRAAGGSVPKVSSQQPPPMTTPSPRGSSATSVTVGVIRPGQVVRSSDYGDILSPSSRFEKISLEEAMVRGRTASVAAGLGTEPEMFTWLMVLLLLLFSVVAWIWFCCVK